MKTMRQRLKQNIYDVGLINPIYPLSKLPNERKSGRVRPQLAPHRNQQ